MAGSSTKSVGCTVRSVLGVIGHSHRRTGTQAACAADVPYAVRDIPRGKKKFVGSWGWNGGILPVHHFFTEQLQPHLPIAVDARPVGIFEENTTFRCAERSRRRGELTAARDRDSRRNAVRVPRVFLPTLRDIDSLTLEEYAQKITDVGLRIIHLAGSQRP
jgi:hypothetical protein